MQTRLFTALSQLTFAKALKKVLSETDVSSKTFYRSCDKKRRHKQMYFRVHLFIANFGEAKISLLYDLTAVLGGDIYCAFSTDVCESAAKNFFGN